MKKYTEEEIEDIFDDGIEFEDLYNFLIKNKDLNMSLKFDPPYFEIKMELVDL